MYKYINTTMIHFPLLIIDKNKSIHTLKMKKVKQEQIKWIVKTSG